MKSPESFSNDSSPTSESYEMPKSFEEHLAEIGQAQFEYPNSSPSKEDSNEEIEQKINAAREAVLNAYKKDKDGVGFEKFDQPEIDRMIGQIEYKTDPTYHTYILEDYKDEYDRQYAEKFGSKEGLEAAIEKFNNLDDKNDLKQLESIQELFSKSYGTQMILPKELEDFATKLNTHVDNLRQIDEGQSVKKYGNALLAQRTEEANMLAEEKQQEQEKQSRRAELLSEPIDKFNQLRSLYDSLDHEQHSFQDKNNELRQKMIELKARLNNFKSIDNFTEWDISHLEDFNQQLDSAIQEFSESKQLENQEKNQASKAEMELYNSQINNMLGYFEPYAKQIPKINAEIQKVITENQAIDSLLNEGNSSDYQSLLERKQKLVNYLNEAKTFMENSLNKQPSSPSLQKEEQLPRQEQDSQQELPDGFWDDFEKPQEEQKAQQELPDDFWDDFEKPSQEPGGIFRGARFNSDGTYTMEYMSHLAASSPGIEKEVMQQLQEYNDRIRAGKNNF